MDVSPNALRREAVQNHKIASEGFDRTTDEKVAATLLLAKVQSLHTLAMLNEQGKRR